MANTKPSAARLRTAAAALIAAAAVASCSSAPARQVVPAPTTSAPAASSDTAATDPTSTAVPESTPVVVTEAPAVATGMSTTDTQAPTTSAGTTLIAVEPSASVAEPAVAPVTTATGAGIAAASWDYSPLVDHLSLDAVTDARMQAPNPAVIRIPRLEVEASIIPLGLQRRRFDRGAGGPGPGGLVAGRPRAGRDRDPP